METKVPVITDRYRIRKLFIDMFVPFEETTKSIYTGHYRFYFDSREEIEKVINYEANRIHTASASYAWRSS